VKISMIFHRRRSLWHIILGCSVLCLCGQ